MAQHSDVSEDAANLVALSQRIEPGPSDPEESRVAGAVEVLNPDAGPVPIEGTWNEQLLQLCQMESAPAAMGLAPRNRTLAEVAAALYWADQWSGVAGSQPRSREPLAIDVWDEGHNRWFRVAGALARGSRDTVVPS